MKAKRHHIFIGTGLVAALSCGLAPLPAVAAPTSTAAIGAATDADAAPESGENVVSRVETSPTSISVAEVESADWSLATQKVIPTLDPGTTGGAVISLKNDSTTAQTVTFGVVADAPSGTVFEWEFITARITGVSSNDWYGTMSTDQRTLTVAPRIVTIPAGSSIELRLQLRSIAGNERTGTISDGRIEFTKVNNLPAGLSHSISYNARHASPVVAPVTLSAPVLGATVTETRRPVFSGTANPGATVNVTDDSGQLVASTTAQPDGSWSVAAGSDLPNGSHAGTVSQSADGSTARYQFSVNVAPAPQPAISPITLTAPALGAQLDPGKPVFSGKGHPGATVVVKGRFGTALGTATVDADGNWSVASTVSLGAGSYSGTAVQTFDGATTSAAFGFTVHKPAPTIVPVTLTSPAVGAEIDPGKPVFGGKGEPGATVTVQGTFGTLLGSGVVKADGTWSIESTVSLVAGSYSGTVRQNVDGKVSSAPFRFTAVKNTDVALTSPALDSVVQAGKPTFAGTGKPGATITVKGQFGTPLGSAVVEADGTWSIQSIVSLVAGSYAGTATQDDEGKVTTAPFRFRAE
ncbi:Ig-like domain-containing protein [Microbacterium sp. NPDC057407]|uniref:Ig-like domain-containing protein n=1 Tax=Microbacterium sp. NPDC057407 TaxID=3346120 RepID=UPI00366CCE1C